MDLRLHSHEFIIKFIDAFRKNPCLWNTMNPEYRNKKSRMKAYNRLLKFARMIEPKITVTDVRNKLQSIRASHRKERKKVSESMKTAKTSNEVYVPKLWYYKKLEFLNHHMEGAFEKSSIDNICEKSKNASETSITDNTSDECIPIVEDLQIKQYISDNDSSNDGDSVKSIIGSSTMDLRLHSHEFIIKFIDAFRKNPCLWNTMNPEYRNKKSRMKAYNRLLKFARMIEPKITVTDVRNKLQSIRASHRKERKKVSESMKTAKTSNEVYVPKLWYYKKLEFLNPHMEGAFEKSSIDNICEKSKNASETSITDNTSDESIPIVEDLQIKQYISDNDSSNDGDSVKSIIGSSTMDLRLHSHEFIKKFIDAFRKNPCLWNTMNPEYRNKKSRMKAYNRLLKFARMIEPKITVTDVRNKLRSIRASHRKERKKVSESMKTAKTSNEVYVPKLWYYKELEFLNPHMEGAFEKSSIDNICEKSKNASETSITDNTSDECIPIVEDLQIKQYISDNDSSNDGDSVKSIMSNFTLDSTDSARDTWRSAPASTSKHVQMQTEPNQPYTQDIVNNEPTNEILSYIARKIERNTDEFEIFGKNVAAELRTMNHQQRIIAKKLMNDVIFHGQQQNLTVETQIQINHLFFIS